jgi:Cellulase (glycosyl hydrolase family 5)
MNVARRRRLRIRGLFVLLAVTAAGVAAVLLLRATDGNLLPEPGATRWSLIEDHALMVTSGDATREKTLDEVNELGADTIRVLARWNEIAPDPRSANRPSFDASDPAAYPGFGPYDDLVRRANAHGLRVLMTLAPDAPSWATESKRPATPEFVNFRPSAREFGDFAAAVARRYSGDYNGLPGVRWFSIWNEPNHELFLKPTSDSPEIYRDLVTAALPRIRDNASGKARVLVGETAPAGRAGKVMGPATFVRRWMCLDEQFQPLTGAAAERKGCSGFNPLDVDGFAHHPYGPAQRVVRKGDVVNLLAIRRLGAYLDQAAQAGRVPDGLPIYATEFGLQSNPPDPTVSTTLAKQAALLNEREEFSFHYPRLHSFAQYLVRDDPARPGTTEEQIWSGFQTGLRFHDGRKKPTWNAWRLPIAVLKDGAQATVWGMVRPGSGEQEVQLERLQGGRFVPDGEPVKTDDDGYFEVSRPLGIYRFKTGVGTSRVAAPVAAPPFAR